MFIKKMLSKFRLSINLWFVVFANIYICFWIVLSALGLWWLGLLIPFIFAVAFFWVLLCIYARAEGESYPIYQNDRPN